MTAPVVRRLWSRVAATVAVGLCAGRARARCSACRTRRSSAPTGRARRGGSSSRSPCFAGRGRARPGRAASSARVRFAAALFVGTLVLRVALGAGRGGHLRLGTTCSTCSRAARARTSTCRACAAFDYGAAVLPRPLRRARARAAGALAPATRRACCSTMHYFGLDTATRLAAFCIVVGALSRAAHLRARAPALRGAHGADRRRARRVRPRDAALRRDLGRRGLPHARAARRDRAASDAPIARRDHPRRRHAVRLVAARRRGLGGDPGPRCATASSPRSSSPSLAASALLAFHGALALATGLDPIGTLHATRRSTRSASPRGARTAYWLFGSPDRVPADPRRADRLAGARAAPRTPRRMAIFAVLAVAALAGFTKAETERIWLFLVPFVCLAAAPLVKRPHAARRRARGAGRGLRAALRHALVRSFGQRPASISASFHSDQRST